MNFFGIEIRHPTPKALMLTAALIAGTGLILTFFYDAGFLDAYVAKMTFISFATGTVLATFGVSIVHGGIRALIIYIVAANIVFLGICKTWLDSTRHAIHVTAAAQSLK